MVSKIFTWVGGGVLTGVLALAGPAGGAAQSGDGAWQSAQDELQCRTARLARSWERVEERMAALADRVAAKSARFLQDSRPAISGDDDGQVMVYSSSTDGPGWLGIRMEEVSAEKTKELKLPAERGVLVTRVTEDSPAAKAGLKVNDVITEFDGQRVEGTAALERMVREVPPGRSVPITVWRDGSAQTLRAELSARRGMAGRDGENRVYVTGPRDWDFNFELPPMPEVPPMPAIPPIPAIQIGPMAGFRAFGAPMLGIDAEDLSGQLGSYFGAPDGEGVLVREVMPSTPAEKAGLKAGDVILRVDGNRVRNAEELRSALREKMDKAAGGSDAEKTPMASAELTVLRAGKQITARVELQPPVRRLHAVRRVAV
ncbi:MAG TPA: PDZ domain-containing protein [Candidatus Binatia bacterium]|nr:PDZ domain-containing protein [Candidatus Binatia bacterium]